MIIFSRAKADGSLSSWYNSPQGTGDPWVAGAGIQLGVGKQHHCCICHQQQLEFLLSQHARLAVKKRHRGNMSCAGRRPCSTARQPKKALCSSLSWHLPHSITNHEHLTSTAAYFCTLSHWEPPTPASQNRVADSIRKHELMEGQGGLYALSCQRFWCGWQIMLPFPTCSSFTQRERIDTAQ